MTAVPPPGPSQTFKPRGVAVDVAVVVALLVGLLALGGVRLFFGDSFGWPGDSALILKLRLMRLALAATTGAALAAAGVALQALLRNPLAEPFILGLSTGAGLGVMVQLFLSYNLGLALGTPHIGAMVGAGGAMLIVYLAGRRHGVLDPLGLLLVGVVLSTVCGSIIMALNHIAGPSVLRNDIIRWMMGFLNEGVGWANLGLVVAVSGALVAALYAKGPAMDAASFSDAEAFSLGVNLPGLRALLFAAASILAAGAVVLAGPLGFVGLIAPHLARLMVGPTHRPLLLASVLIGAMLLIAADMLSVALSWTFDWGLMPLGIFTSLIGGPVFIWMLRPHMGRGEG